MRASILKVCGGALGVSFAFVNSFVEGPPVGRWLLMLAWVNWGLALAVVILSHRHSTLAADAAIAKHDAQGAQIIRANTRIEMPQVLDTPTVTPGGLVTVAFLKARIDEGADHLGISPGVSLHRQA